jgi:lipoate-protein ligase A
VYGNLATEEALIECCQSDTFRPTVRIWINQTAAIVGRYQDVTLEVDEEYCVRNCIPIARRFTGGGTVYHDDGNLNLTVLSEMRDIDLQETRLRNLLIVQELLSQFGVTSSINPPNAILVHGKKISGASAAVRREYFLWHASILVSTSLESIAQALSPSRKPARTNRVRSHWEPITNLVSSTGRPVEMREVKKMIVTAAEKILGNQLEGSALTSCEERTAKRLHNQKYSSAEWNRKGLMP